MSDRPVFRPERPPTRRRELGMFALLLIVGGLLLMRPAWEPRAPDGVIVEVRGDVPRPGFYAVRGGTIADAVAAAGGDPSDHPDTPLREGDRVVVGPDGAIVAPASDPLLVALPVDLNTADPHALSALPGVGPATAAAIVQDRADSGPFYAPEDLARVPGIGEKLASDLAPYVTVGDVGPRPPPKPLDLNTATAAQLERLPGIGPVTAARIVVDREDNGPFRRVDDLDRVKGVGPKTVEKIRDRVVVGKPASEGEVGKVP